MSETAQAITDARPRVIAALAVQFRDLDLAEDAFADAMTKCLALVEPPENMAGWLLTASRRKAIDAIRKREAEARAADGAAQTSDMTNVIQLPEPIADERLRLIFICCHPALAVEARAALALKVICGLPVAEIARVFFTSEATMFQRITRAKRKVRDAGIPFDLPPRKAWSERLDAVLLTLELAYTVAYQDAAGKRDGELSDEVGRLATMIAELLPEEPEALGLAALVWLARSREPARVDGDGVMVPLSEQNPLSWDAKAIDQARSWLDRAAEIGKTGPYQIMAAIQLTHARRGFDGSTDWSAIVRLYDALLLVRPGVIASLNRSVALGRLEGPEVGLKALDELDATQLVKAVPYHVARSELLSQTGDTDGARKSLRTAISLDPAPAERRYLERKLAKLDAG